MHFFVALGNKKSPNFRLSFCVQTEGFEPSTLGAEIRYSIQLNYVCILN